MNLTGYLVNGSSFTNHITYCLGGTFQVVKEISEKQGFEITLLGDFEKISSEKADQIIETRLPLGKFIVEYDNGYAVIDNEDGEAWCDDRNSIPEAIEYLFGLEGEI